MVRTALIAMLFVIAAADLPIPSSASGQAASGASPDHVMADETLLDWAKDIVVITVTGIEDPAATTNRNPPRLVVNIDESIKGDLKRGEVTVVWEPFPHDVDAVGKGTKERTAAWNAKPNPPPEIGSRWIARCERGNKTLAIPMRCRYEFSNERLEWAKNLLRIMELHKANQKLLEKAETKELRSADARVAAKADIGALLNKATLVVSGLISGETDLNDESIFTMTVAHRLDGGPGPVPEHVRIVAPRESAVMIRLRARDDVSLDQELMAFLKLVAVEQRNVRRSAVVGKDEPLYELVDLANGVMRATPSLVTTLEKRQAAPH